MMGDFAVFRVLQDKPVVETDLNVFNNTLAELDDLNTTYAQLARMQISMSKGVENGGPLSQPSMQIIRIVVESISKKVDLLQDPYLFPSMENFSKKGSSLTASHIAVENLLDKVKSLASKVMEMIQRVWEKLKKLMNTIFSKSKAVKEMLMSLIKEAENIPDDAKPSEETVGTENEHLHAKYPFAINGRTDFESAMLIVDTTEKLIKSNCDVINHITSCLDKIGKNVNFDQIRNETERLTAEVKKNFTHMVLKSTKHEGGDTIYKYAYLLNQQACVLRERVSKSHDSSDYSVFPIRVMYDHLDIDYDFQNPEVMTKQEMVKLGYKAAELGEAANGLKNLQPIVERSLDDKIAFLRNNYEDQDRMASQEELTAIQLIRDLFHYVSTSMGKLSADGHKTAVSAGYYIKSCVYKYKHAS